MYHFVFSSSENLQWTVGTGRNTFLWFHCAALANPPEDPPAGAVHMTYKFMQAETRLLSALLHNHGLREVREKKPKTNRISPLYLNNSSSYLKKLYSCFLSVRSRRLFFFGPKKTSKGERRIFFYRRKNKGRKWCVVIDYSCYLFFFELWKRSPIMQCRLQKYNSTIVSSSINMWHESLAYSFYILHAFRPTFFFF